MWEKLLADFFGLLAGRLLYKESWERYKRRVGRPRTEKETEEVTQALTYPYFHDTLWPVVVVVGAALLGLYVAAEVYGHLQLVPWLGDSVAYWTAMTAGIMAGYLAYLAVLGFVYWRVRNYVVYHMGRE